MIQENDEVADNIINDLKAAGHSLKSIAEPGVSLDAEIVCGLAVNFWWRRK